MVQSVRRVIDGLIEAKFALGTLARQALKVGQCLARCDHRCHGRGVGGDDPVVFQPSLEP